MTILVVLLFVVAVVVIWHFAADNARKIAAREASLRIETEQIVQNQRAMEDAACVTQAAAQERPKRRKKKTP